MLIPGCVALRAQDAFPPSDPFQAPPTFASYDESGFQVQEFLAALIQADPRDVERIAALPVERVEHESGESGDGQEDEEVALVTPDCWIYEHMRYADSFRRVVARNELTPIPSQPTLPRPHTLGRAVVEGMHTRDMS